MKSYMMIAAVLAALAATGAAITCYECNTHLDPSCATPSEKHEKDCNDYEDGHEYTLCRKVEMHFEMNFGELHPKEERVHRACGYVENTADTEGNCYYKSGYNTRSWVCACEGEKCNSASLPSAGLLLLLSIPVMLIQQRF